MKTTPILLLLFTLLICSLKSVQAHAQIQTFDLILTKALQYSPALRQIHAIKAQNKAESIRLETLDNPEISIEVRPFTAHSSGAEQEHEVAISQPFRVSHFGSRQKVAELLSQSSEVESKMLLLEFEQNLSLSYAKVWILQERERYLKRLIQKTEAILGKIRKANQSGQLPASVNKLISSEQMRLKVEISGLETERLKALAALIKLAGVGIEDGIFSSLELSPLPEQIQACDDIPAVLRITSKSSLLKEQAKLARLDSFPEFTPRIAFDHTADGDDRVLLGISIPLPIFNSNESEKIKVDYDYLSQQSQQKYLDDGALQNEINLLLASAKNSQIQAQDFNDKVLPAMEEAYVEAEREVFSGQGSPIQLWHVLSEMREVQQQYLEFWNQSLSNRAELIILTGKRF